MYTKSLTCSSNVGFPCLVSSLWPCAESGHRAIVRPARCNFIHSLQRRRAERVTKHVNPVCVSFQWVGWGVEFYRLLNWKFKQAYGQSIRATSQRGKVVDPVRSYTVPVNNGNRFLSDSCTYFALNPASPRVRWVWRDVLLFRGTCFSFLQFQIGTATSSDMLKVQKFWNIQSNWTVFVSHVEHTSLSNLQQQHNNC